MRVIYLGEIIPDSYISWCLRHSKQFERVDHLTKPTLSFTHISVDPLPDRIVLKCDYEDNELDWANRYSPEIPKIFVYCKYCKHKVMDYSKKGHAYNIDDAIEVKKDILLNSLVQLIQGANNAQYS